MQCPETKHLLLWLQSHHPAFVDKLLFFNGVKLSSRQEYQVNPPVLLRNKEMSEIQTHCRVTFSSGTASLMNPIMTLGLFLALLILCFKVNCEIQTINIMTSTETEVCACAEIWVSRIFVNVNPCPSSPVSIQSSGPVHWNTIFMEEALQQQIHDSYLISAAKFDSLIRVLWALLWLSVKKLYHIVKTVY